MSPERIMLNTEHHEYRPATWEDLLQASQVFEGDLHLVGHPDTRKRTPFDGVNRPDPHHGRQYNLVEIPSDWDESHFLDELRTRQYFKVGCMDRDASGPAFEKAQPVSTDELTQLLIAGGGVQLQKPRLVALQTILRYVSQHHPDVEILYTGHDHVCGYVKHELHEPLPTLLGTEPATPVEDRAMKWLLYQSAQAIGLDDLFPGRVKYELERIDRKGNVVFDKDFTGIEIATFEELAPYLPEVK